MRYSYRSQTRYSFILVSIYIGYLEISNASFLPIDNFENPAHRIFLKHTHPKKIFGRQHGIIVVIIHSYTTNGLRGMNDKLVLGYDRGGNYKNKEKSEVTCTRRVVCPFWLRSVTSSCS